MFFGVTVIRICKSTGLILALGVLCSGQSAKQCSNSSSKYINLEDQAIKKVAAEYPAEPGFHANGRVIIRIAVDEEGNVLSAKAICGHPLLRATSVKAAVQWQFQPRRVDGKATKYVGVIAFDLKDANRDRN